MLAAMDGPDRRLPGEHRATDNWVRCVDCRWVLVGSGQGGTSLDFDFTHICPRCESNSLPVPFPRVEAWHLIEIVLGHAGRLDPDTARQEAELRNNLAAHGVDLDAPALRELAAQARLSVERGGYDALAQTGGKLSDKGVPPETAMQLALELLMVAGKASPDVEAVIVLAATALEALLDELWTETMAAFGLKAPAVWPLAGVVRRSSVPRQRILLAELATTEEGPPFDKEFASRWDEVLERRNAVVHGRPFLVSTPCAQEAIRLTADAVAAFARANNRVLAAAAAAAPPDTAGLGAGPTKPATP